MAAPIFISYRREDSSPEAGRLHSNLLHELGSDNVFMDTSGIRPGKDWPKGLIEALKVARLILVVIGPEWLRASNEWGQRRIDLKDDWVRREIETALHHKKDILPVLVGRAKLPPPNTLPKSIASLLERQAVEIRDEYWDHDVDLIVETLRALVSGTKKQGSAQGPYPPIPVDKPDPISEEKISIALSGSLSCWKRVASPLPEDMSKVRIELFRRFRFKTFADAIRFMSHVAPGCDIAMHHPRWENIWRSIDVYLTTWDIGHNISDRDIQLAKYLDLSYAQFSGAENTIDGNAKGKGGNKSGQLQHQLAVPK